MKLFSQYRGLRKELYILFIGRMMTNMGGMIWPVFSLILSLKLGMDAFEIALYMAIVTIVSIPISLLGGKLADKYNKRNIIVICDICSIFAYIYCFFVEISFTSILIFVIASLFQSVEYASYDALIADFTTSKDRERAYSLGYLGNNIGLVLSPIIAGFLFESHLNLSFLINGLSILLSTILIALFIKNVSKEVDDSKASEYEQSIDDNISGFKYIFNNKVILIFIIASMLGNFVYSMWTYLMPYDLGELYGDAGAQMQGILTSLNCIIVVVFTGLITKLFKKILDIDKMKIGELLIISGYLLFLLFAKQKYLCYLCIFLFTYGEIFNSISSSPYLTRRIPESHRGRILSILNVSCNLFTSLMQVIVGKLRDIEVIGRNLSWGFVIIFGIIQILLIFVLKRKDRNKYQILYENNETDF